MQLATHSNRLSRELTLAVGLAVVSILNASPRQGRPSATGGYRDDSGDHLIARILPLAQ